jgi:hypothetical protein
VEQFTNQEQGPRQEPEPTFENLRALGGKLVEASASKEEAPERYYELQSAFDEFYSKVLRSGGLNEVPDDDEELWRLSDLRSPDMSRNDY